MLYFNFIDNSEGIDHSEGQDVVSSTELLSKQCISCRFCISNFKYERNVCDGCYHCIIYESENKNLIFRVITVKMELIELLAVTHLKKLKIFSKMST